MTLFRDAAAVGWSQVVEWDEGTDMTQWVSRWRTPNRQMWWWGSPSRQMWWGTPSRQMWLVETSMAFTNSSMCSGPGSLDGIYDEVKLTTGSGPLATTLDWSPHNCNLTISVRHKAAACLESSWYYQLPKKHDGSRQTMFTVGGKHETHMCFVCLCSATWEC